MGLNEGKIIINNKEIFYKMDSESFINLFSDEINSYVNGDIERYNFRNPQIIDGVLLWIKIIFRKKIISSIELKNADSKLKNSYDNWSNTKMELKRKSHDEWLINQLGQPHESKLSCIKYNYTWGEALSYSDLKGGDIAIAINFNK
ncbi:hypothetical protein [Anaeromicropila herbilytica]|uniref:Uncharacterized protein n=1 Tax=Anaeromicropila herbilytica TaxID=2785025 RepID=A0A7R7EP03_9FIRM|nr:hypothetical protein [Anaeromicropila herbilytica]BCN32396.1 hypothetical protein bsdtb5_36910 [Anaeromicropila herbilytica]